MHQLVSQFELQRDTTREAFEASWNAFGNYLVQNGLAQSIGPIMKRQLNSGYDTDTVRKHQYLALFRLWIKAKQIAHGLQ